MKLLFKSIILSAILFSSVAPASFVNFGGALVFAPIQIALLRSFQENLQKPRIYKTPQKVPVLVLKPLDFNSPDRRQIRARTLELENTPKGADAKRHRRLQIDEADGENEAAAARWRRKCRERNTHPANTADADFQKWMKQYETLRRNGQHGRAAEEHALDIFNVDSNNEGTVVMFADDADEENAKRRRPDGLGVDENDDPVVVEVKHKKARGVIYATAQLRTEEKAAAAQDGRHIVIVTTTATEDEEFPRASRGFRDLSTEFRLCSGEKVYRLNKATMKWELVE